MIQFDLDDVFTDIVASPHYGIRDILHKELRVKVPGAEYLYAYKSGQWDGTAALYAEQTGSNGQGSYLIHRFRSGLVPRVVDLLTAKGFQMKVGFDHRLHVGAPQAAFQQTQVPLREYQRTALAAALQNQHPFLGWWPRGVLSMATGSGKTETAVAIYETNPVPTFFLVHRKDLLIQAEERFKKYGHRPGIIGSGDFLPNAKLNIATMQTVVSIMKKENAGTDKQRALMSLMSHCRQLFIDECHLVAATLEKGNEFVGVSDMFPHALFRYGLTATPFMRSSYDNALLEGCAGSELFFISSKQLIDAGFLTKPKVYMMPVHGQLLVQTNWKALKNSTKARGEYWRNVEMKGIKFNEPRTRTIIEEICKGPFPCLVLVKTLDQAQFIQTMYFNLTRQDLPFVSGKDSPTTRRAAIQALNDGRLPVIMATTIFDEGVDVPALSKVILASGGKSEVKLIQRVGRALRLHAGKQEAVIIDFADEHHAMVKKHADERRAVWNEQGFEVYDG